jgi:hypothetical protein
MSSMTLARQAHSFRSCISAVLALYPCVTLAESESSSRTDCSASGARFAIGEMYTPDLAERARRAARAQDVRIIEPGGAYTTELSPKRLNIEVDRAGIVRDLTCG